MSGGTRGRQGGCALPLNLCQTASEHPEMCKNSHIIDSSYKWYLEVNDLVDELYACHYSASKRSRSSECKQGGQKRHRESTVNENSIIAPQV